MAKRRILKAARISFFSHIAVGIKKQARGKAEVQLDRIDACWVVGSPDMSYHYMYVLPRIVPPET